MRGYSSTTCSVGLAARLHDPYLVYLVPNVPLDISDGHPRTYIRDVKRSNPGRPEKFPEHNDDLIHVDDKIWIPDTAEKLKVKLLIMAHAGQAGNLDGDEATDIL